MKHTADFKKLNKNTKMVTIFLYKHEITSLAWAPCYKVKVGK